jgi:hypothetical protein
MPTSRTRAKSADRVEHAEAAPDPICHRLFNIQQAADFADVPVQRICHWIRTRKLEAYVLAGGLRIDDVDLADCMWARPSKHPRSGIERS